MKTLILTSALVLGLAGLPLVPVQAASTADSETTLELTKNEDVTGPVKPNDPGIKEDPEDPDNPGTENIGDLTLDVAPKAFNFGEMKMDIKEQTYKAADTTSHNQYLQVTDKRDADIQGWTVTAKQTQLLTEQDPVGTAHVLTGSTIAIPEGEARNNLNNPSSAIDANLVTHAATITGTAETAVFEPKKIAGVGKGTSVNKWNPVDVELTIPQNTAKVGKYVGEVTWTLSAPTGS